MISKEDYPYKGLYAYVVPIYIGYREGMPDITVREVVPERALDVVEWLVFKSASLMLTSDPNAAIDPIIITGER